MKVVCFKCKKEFDPEEEGSAEIRGINADGSQTGGTIHICLDCFEVGAPMAQWFSS